MVKFVSNVVGLLLLGAVTVPNTVMGSQDSAYYPGFSNPNTEDEMYYREAVNVLQDVADGEFEALYIKYHGCVWSEYGNGADDHDDNTGCGGDGSDEYWYMGRTQCFRANSAYSLYGVKKGQSTSDNDCVKKHYINSFFTLYGIESFAGPLGVDYEGYGAVTQCAYEQNNQNNGNQEYGNQYGFKHNQLIYSDYVSYGLGCDANGNFINAEFQGAYCDGNHYLDNLGGFDELNSELQNLGCTQVYSASGYDYDADEADGDEDGDGNDNGDEEDGSVAWALLSYSASCSHAEYPKRCPDPHGIKARRDSNLYNTAKSHYRAVPAIMPILSVLFCLGAFYFLYLTAQLKTQNKKKNLDPMDAARDTPGDASLLERMSESFARTATNLSTRTQSIKERLQDYAEEEDDLDLDGDSPEGDYQSPDVPDAAVAGGAAAVAGGAAVAAATAGGDDDKAGDEDDDAVMVNNDEVANAMLADKGIDPTPKAETTEAQPKKKKYKRPFFARLSKFFLGRRKKKNSSSSS